MSLNELINDGQLQIVQKHLMLAVMTRKIKSRTFKKMYAWFSWWEQKTNAQSKINNGVDED